MKSTYLKSVYHACIGLACLPRPVTKGSIVEVPEHIGEKLLGRTVWNEELDKEVPVWEKSTAKAYEEQKGTKAEAVAPAPAEVVIPDQQTQNTNETNEDQNDKPDTAKVMRGRQPAPNRTRLSSEGENDGKEEGAGESTAPATTETTTEPAAKAPVAKVAKAPTAKRTQRKPATK